MGRQVEHVVAATMEVDPCASWPGGRSRRPPTFAGGARSDAAVYRSLGASIDLDATAAAVRPKRYGPTATRSEHVGRSAVAVAKQLSTLRGRSHALEARDAALRTVR
jgi:hypothetical protein